PKVVMWRWHFAGPGAVQNGTARLRPSSSRSRSMSSLRSEHPRHWRQNRQRRPCQSSSRWLATPLAQASSRHSRGQAATSRAFRANHLILPASASHCCARLCPNLHRLAIMGNVTSPTGLLEMRESQAAARALSLEVVPLEIRAAKDIAPAFETLKGY